MKFKKTQNMFTWVEEMCVNYYNNNQIPGIKVTIRKISICRNNNLSQMFANKRVWKINAFNVTNRVKC